MKIWLYQAFMMLLAIMQHPTTRTTHINTRISQMQSVEYSMWS